MNLAKEGTDHAIVSVQADETRERTSPKRKKASVPPIAVRANAEQRKRFEAYCERHQRKSMGGAVLHLALTNPKLRIGEESDRVAH